MKTESLLKPPKSKFLKSGSITLSRGESVGWHVTDKREEMIIVLRGVATVLQEGKEEIELKAGETCYIGENISHNVVNNSKEELGYIYVVCLLHKL